MKRIVLAFIAFSSITSLAQEYHKTLDHSNKWNILLGGLIDCGINCTDENFRTHSLSFTSDSTINDTLYKKLISTLYTDKDTSNLFVGLIREDTLEQKVFFRKSSDKDRLIYDFSLIKGDTIKNFRYHDCGVCDKYVVIESVDTILDLTENQRRRYFIRDYYGMEIWIEGIGALSGLVDLQHIDITPNYEGLLCFWNSNNLIYEKEDNQFGCLYFSSNTSIFETNTIEPIIFPNPSSSEITINHPEVIRNLIIYDLSGQKIKEFTQVNTRSIKINVADLNSGIYIITINENKYKIYIE